MLTASPRPFPGGNAQTASLWPNATKVNISWTHPLHEIRRLDVPRSSKKIQMSPRLLPWEAIEHFYTQPGTRKMGAARSSSCLKRVVSTGYSIPASQRSDCQTNSSSWKRIEMSMPCWMPLKVGYSYRRRSICTSSWEVVRMNSSVP